MTTEALPRTLFTMDSYRGLGKEALSRTLITVGTYKQLERKSQRTRLANFFAEELGLEEPTYKKSLPFVEESVRIDMLQIIVERRLPLGQIVKRVGIVCGYETKDLENWKDGIFTGEEPYVAKLRIGNKLKDKESDATLREGIFTILMHPKTLEEGQSLLLMGSKMKDYVAAIRKTRSGYEVFPVLIKTPEDVNNPKFKRLKRIK